MGPALQTGNTEAQPRLGLKAQPKWADGLMGAPGEASQGHQGPPYYPGVTTPSSVLRALASILVECFPKKCVFIKKN